MEFSIEDVKKVVESTESEERTVEVAVFEFYQQLQMFYQSAVDEVETKLQIINRELSHKIDAERKNPIHQIQHRVKLFKSVVSKLEKKGLPFSEETIAKEVEDFAGVRVISPYTDDIYRLLDSLLKQRDVRTIEIKDYIKEPKASGYRSLHAVVELPVFFLDEVKYLKVEIQFRTIAMDFWASLEHGLRYKNKLDDEELMDRLEKMAVRIEDMEKEMQNIRMAIEEETT